MPVTFRPSAPRELQAWRGFVRLGQPEGGSSVVVAVGELDIATHLQLNEVLSESISMEVTGVIIDLAETTFIDTATVRALARFGDVLATSGNTLTLRSPSDPVNKVICWFGLQELVQHPGRTSFA